MAAAAAAAAVAGAKMPARQMLEFINASPSPFHAVHEAVTRLVASGFTQLDERAKWAIKPEGKYFIVRNGSSVLAFAVGGKYKAGNGFLAVGAHTDSPCLKVKPISAGKRHGYLQVGVECYGGGLWHTWFDRDLTVAGKVVLRKKDGGLSSKLVNVKRPILRVPTLAIHLDRSVNTDGFKLNKEQHLAPILATSIAASLGGGSEDAEDSHSSKKMRMDKPLLQPCSDKHHGLLFDILCDQLKCKAEDIVDFELCLADTNPATLGGAKDEFVFSPRLDNLCSSFCGLEALIASSQNLKGDDAVRLLSLYDHEEVGSNSAHGAASSLTEFVMRRLAESDEKSAFERAVPKSFILSVDMAHAVHPNYSEKHEAEHRPAMHKGPVIKYNANQRYATNSASASLLREVARSCSVPLQDFVVRNDSPCGSTIGAILSAGLGMRTVDIGNPQLSMHSIREMCGAVDVEYSLRLLQTFYEQFSSIDKASDLL